VRVESIERLRMPYVDESFDQRWRKPLRKSVIISFSKTSGFGSLGITEFDVLHSGLLAAKSVSATLSEVRMYTYAVAQMI
jgi:hypothetical protein